MADSLDEFFAKKDKSKKGKKKNVTPDDIAKQLEEGRKFEKMKKDKDKTNLSSGILNSNILDQVSFSSKYSIIKCHLFIPIAR